MTTVQIFTKKNQTMLKTVKCSNEVAARLQNLVTKPHVCFATNFFVEKLYV